MSIDLQSIYSNGNALLSMKFARETRNKHTLVLLFIYCEYTGVDVVSGGDVFLRPDLYWHGIWHQELYIISA